MKKALASISVFCLTGLLAPAAERVALVIGNGGYEHVLELENPTNDAAAVAAELEEGGYEVIRVDNGGVGDMAFALKKFARAARRADVAVFFFAGHGFEVKGKNYLVPVDAKLEIDPDLEGDDAALALEFALDRETIPLELVMRELRTAAGGLKLIVLDCCRNNPFARTRSWARSRSGNSGGLAEVAEGEIPEGTMIVFSGAPGREVPDGEGKHSPFTEALLKEIDAERNAGMMKLFTGLSRRIESDQKPWMKFDGSGQSVAAFVDEPLIPGTGLPGRGGDGESSPGAPADSEETAMRAELERLRREKANAEEDAKMAAEIDALKEQLAKLASEKKMETPEPPPPSRNMNVAQWVIACEAEETRAEAEQAASRWNARGFPSGVLWIPDYSSLSGAQLWLVYVGPWDYADRASVKSTLPQVNRYYGEAYGIKIDQSGKRETLP